MIVVNCSNCNNDFKVDNYRFKRSNHLFCNKKCRSEFEKINSTSTRIKKELIVNCTVCNSKLKRTPTQIRASKTGLFFCDRMCRSKWDSIKFDNTKVIVKCKVCDSEIKGTVSETKNTKYCSINCLAKSKSIEGNVTLKCNYCNIEFSKLKSQVNNLNYCSRNCYKGHTSEIHHKNRPKLTCVVCKSDYSTLPSQSKNSKTCSRDCHNKNLAILIKTDPYYIEMYKNRGINSLLNQNKSDTKPELMVREWLTDNNISFESQLLIKGKFIVDFFIPKYNQVLEVNGDYWHANPLLYGEGKKKLNDRQIKQIGKDKARKNYLEKCGYIFSVAWEKDIYEDVDRIMKKLIK